MTRSDGSSWAGTFTSLFLLKLFLARSLRNSLRWPFFSSWATASHKWRHSLLWCLWNSRNSQSTLDPFVLGWIWSVFVILHFWFVRWRPTSHPSPYWRSNRTSLGLLLYSLFPLIYLLHLCSVSFFYDSSHFFCQTLLFLCFLILALTSLIYPITRFLCCCMQLISFFQWPHIVVHVSFLINLNNCPCIYRCSQLIILDSIFLLIPIMDIRPCSYQKLQ